MLVNFYTQNFRIQNTQPLSFKRNSLISANSLKKDVFLRTTEPDFLELPTKEIFKRIKSSLKQKENLLGKGGEACVWRIEDTDYCVRIPNHFSKDISKSFSKKLNVSEQINHAVAKLGGGATIMPIIKGVTYCSNDISNQEVAKLISEMPIEAFEKLYLQIHNAEQIENIAFDSGFKNVIINPQNKTMTAIDFYKKENNPLKGQILSGMFSSLNHPFDTSLEQNKTCAGKMILAGLSVLETSNSKINPFKDNGDRFLAILENRNIINQNYSKVFRANFENLSSDDAQKVYTAKKIITSLVKQLFGVTNTTSR